MNPYGRTLGVRHCRQVLRAAMNPFVAVMSLLAFGCGGSAGVDPPAQRPATSPLVQGTYFGDVDCTATVDVAGEISEAPPSSVAAGAVIDIAGFPAQEGQGIDIGDTNSIDFLGGTLRGTITDIRIDADAVVVVRRLAGTLSAAVELHGDSVETYRNADADVLEFSVTTTVSAGTNLTLRQSCEGQLGRE